MNRPGRQEAYRFLAKVDRSGGPAACWPWTGTIDDKGYGRLSFDGGYVRAHRLALEIKLFRPLADGLFAIHSCDNPPCCNPGHLREGTPAQNTNDSVSRGRWPHGEASKLAKLTDSDVMAIRAASSPYQRGVYRQLARRYGISPRAASFIAKGQRWAHLGGAQ